jgi:hypothetical protein
MYKKESPRLNVQFINTDTEEVLFEINDRNTTNVGEIFSDQIASILIKQELKNKLPENVIILVSAVFNKV